jgi:hypothetical protein
MSKYRNSLPQLNGGLFLTNGGLETTLIYHEKKRTSLFCFISYIKRGFGIWMDEKLFTSIC